MASKSINSRIQLKNDTEGHWLLAQSFAPLKGEAIIYNTDDNHESPRLKIGDGVTNVNNLPFLDTGGCSVLYCTITEADWSEVETSTYNGEAGYEYEISRIVTENQPVLGAITSGDQFLEENLIIMTLNNKLYFYIAAKPLGTITCAVFIWPETAVVQN